MPNCQEWLAYVFLLSEPSVIRVVKKDGPTKGKRFYSCARPNVSPCVSVRYAVIKYLNGDMAQPHILTRLGRDRRPTLRLTATSLSGKQAKSSLDRWLLWALRSFLLVFIFCSRRCDSRTSQLCASIMGLSVSRIIPYKDAVARCKTNWLRSWKKFVLICISQNHLLLSNLLRIFAGSAAQGVRASQAII